MTSKRSVDAHSIIDMPIKSWWHIIKRISVNMQRHNLPLIAAGVAFYLLLAIFPLLGALISLYGLMVSPAELQDHMQLLIDVVPSQSRYIIEEQLENLTQKSSSTLSWGFALSLVLSLWSSSKGANALITACNITYSESHGRGFLRGLLARFTCTISIIVTIIVALAFITVVPKWISWATGDLLSTRQAGWITWPIMLLLFNASLSALYRYGPHREPAQWRWVTPGSIMATVLWIAASYGFSLYLSEFATYNKTYGSVGGIIILLMWLYLSAYIILLGAETNSAIELQTSKDSTVGEEKPKGERGAFVADHTPDDDRDSEPKQPLGGK
ncbi:YihY/virulence factor BrkB family protein [Salinimonas marina]|uniref:YihY/virulence factor BrkB family protein n=1 Tax=Salinimonas marina TaxID=2785918 RepID=A0A7S9DYK4_9ALTE|nr:YihY/virulence factor BrkB family protein [Salinimonas marina]QPG06356.1 YihY/virulence factor BrkB family protein [Salinimonas marina]